MPSSRRSKQRQHHHEHGWSRRAGDARRSGEDTEPIARCARPDETGPGERLFLALVNSVDNLVRVDGGYGAAPYTTKDPIVLAALVVMLRLSRCNRGEDRPRAERQSYAELVMKSVSPFQPGYFIQRRFSRLGPHGAGLHN